MASTTYPDYRPASRPNEQAALDALFYAESWGSAAAALEVVDCPGQHDAHRRAVCAELRQLQHIERTAALAAAQDVRLAA
jgi:hypothetical protein